MVTQKGSRPRETHMTRTGGWWGDRDRGAQVAGNDLWMRTPQIAVSFHSSKLLLPLGSMYGWSPTFLGPQSWRQMAAPLPTSHTSSSKAMCACNRLDWMGGGDARLIEAIPQILIRRVSRKTPDFALGCLRPSPLGIFLRRLHPAAQLSLPVPR